MSGHEAWTREALARRGFTGWHRFADLPLCLGEVEPVAGGVYLVYRERSEAPSWLAKNPGGTWRGDPTVPREALEANWVDGANVLYIGKANHRQLRTGCAPTAPSERVARDAITAAGWSGKLRAPPSFSSLGGSSTIRASIRTARSRR